jgi:type I restriction enzyme, S subunit
MSVAWTEATLDDVCVRITDGAHASPKSVEHGLPMASVKDMTPYGLDLQSARQISEQDFAVLVRQGCKPLVGDVLIAKDGATALDTVCVILRPIEAVLLSSVAILRPNAAVVLPKFLRYYLDAEPTRKYMKAAFTTGAAIPRVVLRDFKRARIRYPDIRTQERVCAVLSAYDDLIENNTRRIAILEEMARRIYEEWFVRFRFPGHEGVRMVESELGLVPEGWAPCRLERVCSRMNSGNTPSRSEPNYWDGGTVAWYKTKELWDGYLFESEERITELAVAEKKTRVFDAGTILMAIYGSPTVGRLGITTGRCACNQAALGMLPDITKVTFWTLYYTLLSLRVEFNNKAQGAAQQNISKEKVAEMPFLLPAMETQHRFDEVVGPMQAMLRNLQERNRNLRATRDLLLPKLISGELDVSAMPEPEALAA